MSTLADNLKKDRRAYFLIEMDFDGWKKRISTSDQQVEYSGDTPLMFEGLVKSDLQIGSRFDFHSFRYSANAATISMANQGRFQDREVYHKVDNGTVKVWLWSPSTDWSDCEDYPIFQGSFVKQQATKTDYSFKVIDFSGTKGELIETLTVTSEHPADIVERLLLYRTTLVGNQIDFAALRTMESILPGWLFTTVVDKGADTFDIVDRILRECRCARWQKHGKTGVVSFDLDAPAIVDLRDEDFIGEPIFTSTPLSLVVNDVNVSYNYAAGSFSNTFAVDRSNNEVCAQSYGDYGKRGRLEMSLADIANSSMVIRSMARYFDFHAFQHDLLTCDVPYWTGYDIYEGDVAEITHEDGPSLDSTGWDAERCILIERVFTRTGMRQTWWRIDT